MRHWQLRSPATPDEWQRYYHLRWQILRAPWQQPPGSERDDLEAQAYHLMLLNPDGEIAAVGRLHQLEQGGARIRYMAVAAEYQGRGAGSKVLAALEMQAGLYGVPKPERRTMEILAAMGLTEIRSDPVGGTVRVSEGSPLSLGMESETTGQSHPVMEQILVPQGAVDDELLLEAESLAAAAMRPDPPREGD